MYWQQDLFAKLLDANAVQRQAVLGDTAAGKKRALQEEPAGKKRALQEEPGKLAGISGLNPSQHFDGVWWWVEVLVRRGVAPGDLLLDKNMRLKHQNRQEHQWSQDVQGGPEGVEIPQSGDQAGPFVRRTSGCERRSEASRFG